MDKKKINTIYAIIKNYCLSEKEIGEDNLIEFFDKEILNKKVFKEHIARDLEEILVSRGGRESIELLTDMYTDLCYDSSIDCLCTNILLTLLADNNFNEKDKLDLDSVVFLPYDEHETLRKIIDGNLSRLSKKKLKQK